MESPEIDLSQDNKIVLPELKGVDLLRKLCLHPSKATKQKAALHKTCHLASPISTRPPSAIRLKEETGGKKRRPSDAFSKFLLSHPEDRPWRRGPKDLPLWDVRETLNNKAAIITSEICLEFCDWYRSLGGNAVIDEEKVAQLFEIRIPPYSPPTQPKLTSKSVAVRAVTQLKCKLPKDKSHLTRPAVQKPPQYEAPRDLVSMQRVFEDIMDLKITRAFCSHLREEPDSYKPLFLVEQNQVD